MHQFLLAICGLPASGKTTLAQALLIPCREQREVQLISTDTWRDDDFYSDFQPWREQRVREIARRETQEFLLIGDSIIHDDTNYYASMRHELYDMSNFVGCFFGVIHVTTPLAVALEWNEERQSHVPNHVIERIHDRFDTPGEKYAWDKPIIKVDLSRVTISNAVDKITEKLDQVESQTERERHAIKKTDNQYDVISRKVVSSFLKKFPELRGNIEISRIRRDVMAEGKEKGITPEDFEKSLLEKLMRLVI